MASARLIHRTASVSAWVVLFAACCMALACTASGVPDGVLACSHAGRTTECPEGMLCARDATSGALRCFAHAPSSGGTDAQPDARMLDDGSASTDARTTDGPTMDARRADAASTDAGDPDAGPRDAARSDTGAPDGGRMEAGLFDSGPVDASSPDTAVPARDAAALLPDGWPACDGPRRYVPTARSTDDLVGDYCLRRRADGLVVECHDVPEDCTCLEGRRIPEEWECVLRPVDLRCFRYRACRTSESDRLVGCYDGEATCTALYQTVIACDDVPLSPLIEACRAPEELEPAPSGFRAVDRPGIGCCWQ